MSDKLAEVYADVITGKVAHVPLKDLIALMPGQCTPSRAAMLTGAHHDTVLASQFFAVPVEVKS